MQRALPARAAGVEMGFRELGEAAGLAAGDAVRGDARKGPAACLAVFAGWREGRGEMAAEEGLADEGVAGGVVGVGRVHLEQFCSQGS